MSRFNLTVFLAVSFCLIAVGCGPSRVTLNPESDINLIRKVAVTTVEKTPELEVAAGQWEVDLISLGFIVVDRGNIESIMKEQGFSLSGATSGEDVMKIGKMLGVDGMLFIDKGIQDWFSEKYGQVHLVDVNTGRVVFTANPDAVYDLYKPLRKVLQKKEWEHFYKNPFYTWGSYLIGKPYVVNKNNITLDRFKASWLPGFDQNSIKKVALSPQTQHDLLSPLISAGYDVIERRQLEKIMKELGLSVSGVMSQSQMKKIGKLYGIDGMLFSGQVKQELRGQGYCTHHFIKLIHLETGSVVWAMRIFDFKEEVDPNEIGKFLKKMKKRFKKTAVSYKEKQEEPEEEEPVSPVIEKKEPVKEEPAKVEPAKVEPDKVEPAKVEPAKVEPVKEEPAKVEPAKVEPAKVEPAKEEPSEGDSDEEEEK